MTTEEALAAAQVNDTGADEVITIDNDLRKITIPASITLLGVESDENVQTLHFQMPKTYKGLDLSEFAIRINYVNANNAGDTYAVDDSEISGENIVFTWTVGRVACMYKGNTKFIVCLKKKDASVNVLKEFNTSLTSLPVLEGLETTEAVVAENPDIIEQILKKIDELTSILPDDIATAVEEYMANNPIEETDPTVPDWAKQPEKPTYTASEVCALPDTTKIPSKTSDLQNDSGFTALALDESLADNTKAAPAGMVGELKEDLADLDRWNLIDLSKTVAGYGYTAAIGYPPNLKVNKKMTAIDDLIPCNAGETYTINWLYGAVQVYDSDKLCLVSNYINAIPYTFTIPKNGAYMTVFGVTARMVDLMLIKGDSLPDKYIPHSVFDIKVKELYGFNPKPLSGVKWCAFGDSLTDSVTLASESAGTKNYVNYVSESLCLAVTNCGKAGSGYKKQSNNFVSRVDTIPSDTEILTVFGSFNDFEYVENNLGVLGDTTEDTLYGAMHKFITDTFARCPDVIVGIITPTPWGYLHSDASNKKKADLYVKALIDTAKWWNLPVLDLYNESNLRPWDDTFKATYYKDDTGDGTAESVHPLSNAHKRFIAPKVESFIKRIYPVY